MSWVVGGLSFHSPSLLESIYLKLRGSIAWESWLVKTESHFALYSPFLEMLKTAFVAGLFLFPSTNCNERADTYSRIFIENWGAGDAKAKLFVLGALFQHPFGLSHWSAPSLQAIPTLSTINSPLSSPGCFSLRAVSTEKFINFSVPKLLCGRSASKFIFSYDSNVVFLLKVFVGLVWFFFSRKWLFLIHFVFSILISISWILRVWGFFGLSWIQIVF